MKSRWWGSLSAAFVLVTVVLLWALFAPLPFGGQASYVIVAGASMDPILQRGDLVVVRKEVDYQVGDVVTYRHPQVGPVIHRIVGREDGRYVLKGDNNHWTDSYRPSEADVIGELWFSVRGVGAMVGWLRAPLGMALLSIGIALVAMTALLGGDGSHPPRRGWRLVVKGMRRPELNAESATTLVFVLAALGVASLVLAVAAFSRPMERTVSDEIPYQSKGTFSYTAAAPKGIYDGESVRTSEPVFQQLTRKVSLQFEYRLVAEEASDLEGDCQLVAEVSDVNGWRRTIEIAANSSFKGPGTTLTGEVDLGEIERILENLRSRTGVESSYYTLSIIPTVRTRGKIAGQDFHDSFSPRLEFKLDELQLQMVQENPLEPEKDPVRPSQDGAVLRQRSEPNTINLLGSLWTVGMVRWGSAIVFVLVASGLGALAVFMRRATQRDEATAIRWKYGPMMVSLREGILGSNRSAIELANIGDLARVAEKKDQMILWLARGGSHDYYVREGESVYHVHVGEPAPPGDLMETGMAKRPRKKRDKEKEEMA